MMQSYNDSYCDFQFLRHQMTQAASLKPKACSDHVCVCTMQQDMATAKTLLLAKIPNDVWLCSSSLVGIMGGGIAIYLAHHFHNRSTPDYKEPKENLAVNGLSVLRGMTIATVAVGWVLVLQMGDTAVPALGWWNLNALITGLWCMIRLFGTLLVAASAYVFDAHMSYRLVCVFLPPLLMVVDMFSEIRFTQIISCMDAGICDMDTTLHRRYYILIGRDLVAIACLIVCWALGIWLTSLFGWCSNGIIMPRKEHRELRHKLDWQARKLASLEARPLPQVSRGLRGAMRRHRKKQEKTAEEYER